MACETNALWDGNTSWDQLTSGITYVRTQHNLLKPWPCLATSAVRYSLSKHEFVICNNYCKVASKVDIFYHKN